MFESSAEAVGIRRRTLAFIVDVIVLVGPTHVIVSGDTDGYLQALSVTGFVSGVVGLFYHILLEGLYGQTVGKWLLGIQARREDGDSCTFTAAAVRTLFRFVDWLPVAYLLGLVSITVTERRQRVGDVAARTVVVDNAGQRRG